MKNRRQEAHIMAQEEGLGLNSFFEFQAIEMLDYLRMKSEKKLAKNAMPAVQIERGRKGERGGATGKAGGEGGGVLLH